MNNFLFQFNMDKILDILQSSTSIEEKLSLTFKQPKFTRLDQRAYKKRRPLLNRELYILIEQLGELPSIDEFSKAYFKNHPSKFSQTFAEESAIRHAYCSLVRDLHFYFILKESGQFDTVKIDYLFDLRAQTDILVSKGSQKLGIQLFSGNNIAKERKRKRYEKMDGKNNYELFFFGSQSTLGKRKELKINNGSVFTLHSTEDVRIVLKQLQGAEEVTLVWDVNKDKFYDEFVFVESVDSFSLPKDEKTDKTNIEFSQAKHSILFIGSLSEIKRNDIEKICANKGLTFYYCHVPKNEIIIYDGYDFAKYGKIIKNNLDDSFNMYQYIIEHEVFNKDIIVSAGAGSGKTYTLISRTIYLLDMGFIKHVHEIAMITFTNEAANNMREKLAEKFMHLYRQTGETRYRRYLEELREMKIMTIPAFARYILKEYGHHIGIGQNFSISSLTMEKRREIDKYLDTIYRNEQLSENIFDNLQYYNLSKFVERVSETLDQKGIMASDLSTKPFKNNDFANLINDTLIEVEKELTSIKQDKNILTLADLTRYLTKLLNKEFPIQSLKKKFSYLFIDEFQDTDNSQIDFIVKLTVKSNIPLLVVGDIKQGIYRFRGANVSAFEIIKTALIEEKRNPKEHFLVYNYRTSSNLLNSMEDLFEVWRTNNHLSRDKTDIRMLPARKAGLSVNECYQKYYKPLKAEDVFNNFENMTSRYKKDNNKNHVLAILVRKNKQVAEIGQLLKKSVNKNSPTIQVVMEGTLFQSDAAKDLLFLLNSWLKPTDSVALYSFSQTSFSRTQSTEIEIEEINGNYTAQDYQYELPIAWFTSLNYLKFAPAIMVLNDFLSNVPYEEHLSIRDKSEIQIKQYQLNLFKILSLLNTTLDNDNVDLLSVYNWISNEVATNTRDDEAELAEEDFKQDYIKVLTVHKSKGLEFDTVILPYTKDIFIRELPNENNTDYDFCDILAEVENNNPIYGWTLYKKKDGFYNDTPETYTDLRTTETTQTQREETRNLYVAMTRAKEQLLIYGLRKYPKANIISPNSWSDLIEGG